MTAAPATTRPAAWEHPWWVSLGLFAGALALRLLYVVQASSNPLQRGVYGLADSIYYHRRAVDVSRGDLIGPTPYVLGPLYHHVMGVLYALTRPDPDVVRLFQAALGAATCVLLYWIGRRCFDDAVGLLAGGTLAVYGLHIYYSGVILPTLLVTFLNLLFLLVMARPGGGYTWGVAFWGGVLAGLAALAKSNALLLVPASLAVFWWVDRERGARHCAVLSAALVAGAALALAPGTAHNYAASGEFVLTNTSGGRNLWKGNGPYANGSHVFLPMEDQGTGLRRYLRDRVDPELSTRESDRLTRETLTYVMGHPGATARLLAKKLVLFFNAVELGVRDQFYFAKGFSSLLALPLPGYGLVAPLGLVGMAACWRRRRELAALYALFAVQVVSFLVVFVLARYRLVAVGCLLLFGSQLVLLGVSALREARWKALPLPLLAVAVLALGVNHPLAEFPPDRGLALQFKRLGNLLRDQGRAKEAITAYQRALDNGDWQDRSPFKENFETRLRIARCTAMLGRNAEARRMIGELHAELAAARPRADDFRFPLQRLRDSLDQLEQELRRGPVQARPAHEEED